MNKIYTSDEWKLIHLSIRADIVPVAEKVKKSTQIELWKLENKGYGKESIDKQGEVLNQWLEKSGLAHRQYNLDHYVCHEESLLDKLWKREISIDDFLGYPECCIKNHREHTEKVKQYFNDKIELSELSLPQGVILGREIIDAIKKGRYNLTLNYVLHMPCSAYCKESITFGKKIKDCLEKNDIEAAEWLRKFNEDLWQKFGNEWTEETWYDYIEKRKKDMKS